MASSSDDDDREHLTKTYRFALGICIPTVRWWGRLEVEGLEHVPPSGPLIVTSNHDSYWDPVVVGIAAIKVRQIRALAKSSLWKVKGLNLVLNGMRQIPVVRGTKDTDALDRAMTELRGGSCVGIFIEGTRSLGRKLRARSGIGRMAAAVPDAKIVCAAVAGTTDIPRFPRAPAPQGRLLRARRRADEAGRGSDRARGPRAGRDARDRPDQRGWAQAEGDRAGDRRAAGARKGTGRGAHPARGHVLRVAARHYH